MCCTETQTQAACFALINKYDCTQALCRGTMSFTWYDLKFKTSKHATFMWWKEIFTDMLKIIRAITCMKSYQLCWRCGNNHALGAFRLKWLFSVLIRSLSFSTAGTLSRITEWAVFVADHTEVSTVVLFFPFLELNFTFLHFFIGQCCFRRLQLIKQDVTQQGNGSTRQNYEWKLYMFPKFRFWEVAGFSSGKGLFNILCDKVHIQLFNFF